jgi:hypothetical protein
MGICAHQSPQPSNASVHECTLSLFFSVPWVYMCRSAFGSYKKSTCAWLKFMCKFHTHGTYTLTHAHMHIHTQQWHRIGGNCRQSNRQSSNNLPCMSCRMRLRRHCLPITIVSKRCVCVCVCVRVHGCMGCVCVCICVYV